MSMKYPPIKASCDEVFDRIKECETLASKSEQLQLSWEHVWDVLTNLSDREDEQVGLNLDFAPYSFTFRARGLLGGLIFHGKHDNGGDGGAPTFSVNIDGSYGWSLHT